MKKLALFLVICMLLQLLSVAAFADGLVEESQDDPAAVEEIVTPEEPDDPASDPEPDLESDPEPDPDPEPVPEEPLDPVVEPVSEVSEAVAVVFECAPAEAVITVYDPAVLDEAGEPAVVDPQADGSWLLLPGEYLYDAAAEGFVSLVKAPFTVAAPEDGGALTVFVSLQAETQEAEEVEETEAAEEGEEEEDGEMSIMAAEDFVIDTSGVLVEYRGTANAVAIPQTVTEIYPYCFANHREITDISIPDSVSKIGEGAFSGCTRLTGVSLPAAVVEVAGDTFYGCTALQTITWSQVTEIGANAFYGCTSLRGLALPASVTKIWHYAFANCRGLTAVSFPAGIEEIYDNAFSNCPGLAEVDFSACTALTKLGGSAFQGCSGLNRLTLPPALTEIENFCFQYCYSLTELRIPDGVTKIGREAFSGCRSLSVVVIPGSVDQMLTQAFFGVAGGCAFIIDNDAGGPSIMGEHCIPSGAVVFGWHHMPVDNPELYCKQNNVTFYRIQVVKFAERCYNELLGRPGDLPGIVYWAKQLAAKTLTGAACISQFVNSPEYNGLNLSNEDKVSGLYRTMLDREPDSAGLAYWKGLLDNGVSIDYIVNGFAGAPEFSAVTNSICADYLINAGSIKLTQARDQNPDITAFVARCYTQVLDRPFDVDGLNYWCGNILYINMTGAVLVDSFVNSDEFRSRGLSYDEQVEILYLTMLNRPSDVSGKTDWVNYLANYGVSIRSIINGFADAREFRLLCRKYGMNPGQLTNLEARDRNRYVARFVMDCYTNTYAPGEYTPSAAELNNYCQQILSKAKTPAQIAYEFAFSRDCVERNLTNQQFIVMLYHIYLGRETDPTPAEYNPWIARLVGGMTREQAANAFAASGEHSDYVKAMGIK